ncbi:constitutive coactivator of peroxisome proliferator-activated receptor gamma-like isoform X1 [Dermacentor variabilis]|uniref:constitutive coactivator of peroxisome proliferator-activated receptor gamma-like isoform X1 n=1 Tax=Dermacentor variabilis TaxID=34621 RepID=UPI003F5B83F5
MGIWGLQTFLETRVQGGCTPVDILEEARRFALYSPPGTKPTIVVDGLSLIRWLYNRTYDYIFGGPWRYLSHLITEFVRSFQERGIDLVFFFDGIVCGAKVQVWRTRRSERLLNIKKTFQKLRDGCWTGNERNDFSCPNGTAQTLCFVIKYLTSCKVFYAMEECDKEVARYAERHPECFAVLGQDTDYVIFNMSVLYLSTLYLDISTLQTRTYNAKALACHLELSPELLPLFACLAGNDTVSKEHLMSFHDSVGCRLHHYGGHAKCFQRIAAVIRQKDWRAIPDSSVARHTDVDLDLLKEGVRAYNLSEDGSNLEVPLGIDQASWSLVVSMYKHAATLPTVLQVLYGREIYLGETMEEPIATHYVPAYSCFRPVRRRIYWVLFGGDESVFITEHVTYPENMGIRDETVGCAPFPFQGEVPSLYHLWSGDPSLEVVRWRLFCGCLQMERQLEQLRLLPSSCVVLCCTLRQMFLAEVIGEKELSALILQCILPHDKKLELSETQIPKNLVNADLVIISTYVMIGVQCVMMVLSACGQPLPMESAAPWLFFDGKLFHLLYRKLSWSPNIFFSLLEHDDALLHLYHQLWSIVTAEKPQCRPCFTDEHT